MAVVVLLEGATRFVVDALERADSGATPARVQVRTRAGEVTIARAEFTVTALGATTVVVHALPSRDALESQGSGVSITSATGARMASRRYERASSSTVRRM